MHFDKSARRRRLGGDPFRRFCIGRADIHHAGGDARIFQMQRFGKPAAAPAVLHHDEARRTVQRQQRVGRVQQPRNGFRTGIFREADGHAVCAGLVERRAQRFRERMPCRREHLPLIRRAGNPCFDRLRRTFRFDQPDRKRPHPRVHAGRRLVLVHWLRRAAGEFEFRKRPRDFRHARVGKFRQPGDARQAQLLCRFGNQLADRDRIQMQVAQHAALVAHGRRGQLCALGDETADQFDERGRRGWRMEDGGWHRSGSSIFSFPSSILVGFRQPGRRAAFRHLGHGRGLARVREKFRLPVQVERPREAVGEQRGGLHRRAQREGCAHGLQQAVQGIAAGVERDHGRGGLAARQPAQHLARADFHEQVNPAAQRFHGAEEPHRRSHLPAEQVAQVFVRREPRAGDSGKDLAFQFRKGFALQLRAQHRRGRADQRRVKRVGNEQPARGPAARGGEARAFFDGVRFTCDDGLRRRIVADHGELFAVEKFLDLLPRRGNGQHGAGGAAQFGHRRAAHARDAQQRFLVARAGPVQRGDFAQAVADGGAGFEAECRQDFQPRERGGDHGRLHHARRNRVAVRRQFGARIQFPDGGKAPPPRAAIEMHRRTLAGKQKCDAGRGFARTEKNIFGKFQTRGDAVEQPRFEGFQFFCEGRRFRRDDGRADFSPAEIFLQLGREVGQFRARNSGGERPEISNQFREFFGRLRREQKQFRVLARTRE